MTRLRVAAIGVAHPHVGALREAWTEYHDVVAATDPDPGARARFGSQFPHATIGDDWRRLLDRRGDIDLAYVLGRHNEMSEPAKALLDAGIPVVIDKPGGTGSEEVGALAETARSRRVPSAALLVQRIGPLPQLIARVVEPVQMTFQFIAGPPQRYIDAGAGWLLDPEVAGGGVLLFLGVHLIDLALSTLRAPISRISGIVGSASHGLHVEDHAVCVLADDAGRIATVEAGYLFPPSPAKRYVSYLVTGRASSLSVDTLGRVRFTEREKQTEEWTVDVDSDHYYRNFVRSIADHGISGLSKLPSLADLAAAIRVVEAVYAGAKGTVGNSDE